VTGLLGVLAQAKERDLIRECKPILDEMVRVAGFWIGNDASCLGFKRAAVEVRRETGRAGGKTASATV
jgi:hypothetical protein